MWEIRIYLGLMSSGSIGFPNVFLALRGQEVTPHREHMYNVVSPSCKDPKRENIESVFACLLQSPDHLEHCLTLCYRATMVTQPFMINMAQ